MNTVLEKVREQLGLQLHTIQSKTMNNKTILLALIAIIFCLIGSGCRSKNTVTNNGYLEYSCKIPDELNKEITLHHKDGAPRKHDAHKIYRENHRIGWLMQLRHYAKTGRANYDYFSGWVPQEYGIEQSAKLIGISEARTAILKQELIIGYEELKKQIETILKQQK